MNDDLTYTDQLNRLALTGDQLRIMQLLADADLREGDRRLARIANFVSVLEMRCDVGATIESDLHAVLNTLSEQHSTITSLCALVEGAVAILHTLRDQRDDALRTVHSTPTAEQLYDRLVELIARVNGCSNRDAHRIAYILTSSDDDVLTNDVVIGAERLEAFRTAVFAAALALDEV